MCSPIRIAQARSRAYTLLGQLFLKGLTPELRCTMEALSLFGPFPIESSDDETWAAAYQTTFGLNVLPFASVFLEPDGQLGGWVSNQVIHAYRTNGFDGVQSEPDHIGLELSFLAHLTMKETLALEMGHKDAAAHIHHEQRHFLDGHLLGWLPALVNSIRQENIDFFATVADVALDLVVDHRTDLGPSKGITFTPPLLSQDLLANPKTGLREVAHYLAHHARSGVYLSRQTIQQLGRVHRLPGGFGNRALMLTNVLRAAVRYQAIPAFMAQLQALIDFWQTTYEALSKQQIPGMASPVAHWQSRLATTRQYLDQLELASLTASDEGT